ncbi:MAG: glycosyltransferase [Roseivirga sp.]|nr:glycosyltransferase [Roseivirga sp.]
MTNSAHTVISNDCRLGATTPVISVISPVFKAKDILPELVRRLHDTLAELTEDYEIILVDDRSPDGDWEVIREICRTDDKVKGIRLSINCGQNKAIIAGMEAASGDFLIVMDCDLQEDVNSIRDLYAKIQEGYDVVLTKKKSREFGLLRNGITRVFYAILTFLTNSSFSFYNTGLLSIINSKVKDAMLQVNTKNWFYLPVLSQVGFNRTQIEVTHHKRFAGKSSYSFKKLYLHGINLILGHSVKLLHISIGLGLVFVFFALIWAAVLITVYFNGDPQSGYTSIMVALLLFTGLILSSIGVVGLYIGKIFEQAKNDPDYFIDQTLNFEK